MRHFESCRFEDLSLRPDRVGELRRQLSELPEIGDPVERWRQVSRGVLLPTDPFPLHRALFDLNFRDWDGRVRGPAPAVIPTPGEIATTNLGRWLRELGMDSWPQLHAFSVSDRRRFLEKVILRLELQFREAPEDTVDLSEGTEHPVWFPGARMNIVDSVFAGNPGRSAIVFQREGDQEADTWSLEDLKSASGRVANGLSDLDLRVGDAVAVAMPMTAWAVAIYLGIVRAGMVVVSIADSFAPEEIRTRLRIGGARLVFTQDVVIRSGRKLPMYEKLLASDAPPTVVVGSRGAGTVRLRRDDLDFSGFLSDSGSFETLACDPDDPINVLFSSGTTGDPKAIPWDHTTPLRCALDGMAHQDIRAGDLVAWPTSLGWMMGPWLIFASLMNRASLALYEGPPNTREFCRFVEERRVTVLGLVPSLVRAWRNEDLIGECDWSRIRMFSSTGESSNSEDMLFLMARAGYKPVIEYCGGTEIGGAYISSTPIQPNCPSCFSAKTLGIDLVVLDDDGALSDVGEVFLVPPAVGLSRRLLNRDHHEVYFEDCPRGPGGELLRRHGDELEVLPGGYFRALGRADDTMNLSGIKVSSAELERVLDQVDGIVETAAIGVSPPEGGPSRLLVYAVPIRGAREDAEALRSLFQQRIRDRINPLFAVSEVVLIDQLPRTASNKVMRRVLRSRHS